jgi:hypothetical protein
LKGVLSLLKAKTIREDLANGKLNQIDNNRLYKAANILLS